jgi:hypothetical protein
MLNVICFYWRGIDRPGWMDPFLAVEYISKLQAGIARNLTLKHKFICFTNEDVQIKGVETRMFGSPSYKGCLPKLCAFDPKNGLEGRVVMLDLDIVITGDLDEMFSYDGSFMTREAFRVPGKSGGDMVFFEAGKHPDIWMDFRFKTSRFISTYKAQERSVYRDLRPDCDFVQRNYPGQVLSYRNHVKKTGMTDSCRVVSFHGKPRPHEVQDVLVQENWV